MESGSDLLGSSSELEGSGSELEESGTELEESGSELEESGTELEESGAELEEEGGFGLDEEELVLGLDEDWGRIVSMVGFMGRRLAVSAREWQVPSLRVLMDFGVIRQFDQSASRGNRL